MSQPRPTSAPTKRSALAVGLAVFGLYQLVLGLYMAAAPGSFFDQIAHFGPRNDHYLRDVATYNLVLGAVALIAVRERKWRIPVLAFAVFQYALHAINHLVDIGEATPERLGPANAVVLITGLVLLAWLGRQAREERVR